MNYTNDNCVPYNFNLTIAIFLIFTATPNLAISQYKWNELEFSMVSTSRMVMALPPITRCGLNSADADILHGGDAEGPCRLPDMPSPISVLLMAAVSWFLAALSLVTSTSLPSESRVQVLAVGRDKQRYDGCTVSWPASWCRGAVKQPTSSCSSIGLVDRPSV
jgi:hypothetical protein